MPRSSGSIMLGALPAAAADGGADCRPTADTRPVCPARAPVETASFLDDSARVEEPRDIRLEGRVYIGPFARLLAGDDVPISIGEESNVHDGVTIAAAPDGRKHRRGGRHGVEIGERVILANGATVKGPARVGVEGSEVPGNIDGHAEVFTSFGAEIDGAVVEENTQVSALARVGPGVVRGINFDPGNTAFNPDRDLPKTDSEGVELGTDPEECIGGRPKRSPAFRNRIIGEVCLGDPASRLGAVMGSEVSLRADEGEPLQFGAIRRMESGVISHALEETTVEVGDGVRYGRDAIVHGGGRRQDGGGRGTESTFVEDDVTLGAESVTFRSLVGARSRIGAKSAVVNSELAPG